MELSAAASRVHRGLAHDAGLRTEGTLGLRDVAPVWCWYIVLLENRASLASDGAAVADKLGFDVAIGGGEHAAD
jgi:hypothetical protein